jgi:hypothetical protein
MRAIRGLGANVAINLGIWAPDIRMCGTEPLMDALTAGAKSKMNQAMVEPLYLAVQAVWAGVLGGKIGVALKNVGVLNVPIPFLRLDLDAGISPLPPGRPVAAEASGKRGEGGPGAGMSFAT